VQGEGIVDVTTHLVDLVQWETFPGVRLAKSDVEIVSAKTWPTMITPEQFKTSSGGEIASTLAVDANGEFTWRLKGVHCEVSVVWNFMAPPGTGDTHYSLMRGSKAELIIEQGAKENYKPVLYVRSRGDAKATEKALLAALNGISRTWPGVRAEATKEKGVWRIAYPKKYDVGHEAHFSQVVRTYLDWMKAGRMEDGYIDNMIVKYHTIVEAWKKSRNPVKVGIIGLDTSHALAFAEIMNVKRPMEAAGYRVVAAYQWGSRDIVSSTNRYPTYIPKIQKMGVEIVPSIKELLEKVDVVCLETNDGREHFRQAEEVFASGKRVFIDKPLAHNLADALKIYDAAVKYKAQYFSSSALRFTPVAMACRAGEYGPIAGASLMAPSPVEQQGTHNFYTWYGIHGFEMLMAVMGMGVEKVSCFRNDDGDIINAVWKDGRMGELRLNRNRWYYAGYILPQKPKDNKNPLVMFDGYSGYGALVREIIRFFETGKAPVSPEETLELMALMEAAEMSARRGGEPVTIAQAIEACRERPFWKFW
jgi:predicted dehydrogenase